MNKIKRLFAGASAALLCSSCEAPRHQTVTEAVSNEAMDRAYQAGDNVPITFCMRQVCATAVMTFHAGQDTLGCDQNYEPVHYYVVAGGQPIAAVRDTKALMQYAGKKIETCRKEY